MDGYAVSSCDLARLAEVGILTAETEEAQPSEERIRQKIIQVVARYVNLASCCTCPPAPHVRVFFPQSHGKFGCAQLESENPNDVAAAAEFLFERAHMSHLRSMENKEQMRRDGAIPVLFKALESPSREARYHACSALSELAFRNELNCMAIAQSDGGLESIMEILVGEDVALKGDALLVVNNCAAFCPHVCTAIVSCPGMLDAIRALVDVSAAGASSIAVGLINCLSRCKEVQMVLLHAGFLEALLPVVRSVGVGDKHEAHVARATMAIANLTEGACEGVFEKEEARRAALNTTVKILSHSIKGENWAGIHFAPYSVIYPICNLAHSSENKEVLMECGLADHLTSLIRDWKLVGLQGEETLGLAIKMTEDFCASQKAQRCMRDAGMMHALERVVQGKCTEDVAVLLQAARILQKMTEAHRAFYMGQHSRLGANSPLFLLDECVMGQIANLALGCAVITPLGAEPSSGDSHSADDVRKLALSAALARQHQGGGGSPPPGLRRTRRLSDIHEV
jgi:hypothetical protein